MRTPIALFGLAALAFATPGCNADACSCDLIASESKCVEFSAPANPLYAAQLAGSCSSVLSSLCTSLGGAYDATTACPRTDLVADCVIDNASYVQTEFWYSSGGDPLDPSSSEPDDDCSGNGVVNRY